MNDSKRLKEIDEKAKQTAAQLFKKRPKDVQEELNKTFTMGKPENLVKPDNKSE